VVEGSPAHRGGLRSEDLILQIDGSDVGTMDDLQRLMDAHTIDRATAVTIYRGGKTFTLDVTPSELPG